MIRRYKKYTESTEAFWKQIDAHLARAKLTSYAASVKMGKDRTLLRSAWVQGVPLCPSSLNDFCEAVEVTPFERERLHTLAARGVGYEINP